MLLSFVETDLKYAEAQRGNLMTPEKQHISATSNKIAESYNIRDDRRQKKMSPDQTNNLFQESNGGQSQYELFIIF